MESIPLTSLNRTSRWRSCRHDPWSTIIQYLLTECRGTLKCSPGTLHQQRLSNAGNPETHMTNSNWHFWQIPVPKTLPSVCKQSLAAGETLPQTCLFQLFQKSIFDMLPKGEIVMRSLPVTLIAYSSIGVVVGSNTSYKRYLSFKWSQTKLLCFIVSHPLFYFIIFFMETITRAVLCAVQSTLRTENKRLLLNPGSLLFLKVSHRNRKKSR